MELILASRSPRRKRLLKKARVEFLAVDSGIDESAFVGAAPEELAKKRAVAKAAAVSAKFPDALVVGADTIVIIANRMAGKPRNAKEARGMLEGISGRRVRVITAVAAMCEGTDFGRVRAQYAIVKFRKLSEKEIDRYIRSRKWAGKAGGFNIEQSPVRNWVEKIYGDKNVVIGLMVDGLLNLLRGIEQR